MMLTLMDSQSIAWLRGFLEITILLNDKTEDPKACSVH